MAKPIVLDVETQYTFKEVGSDHKKLKVSVVAIYDYQTGKFDTFLENELNRLFTRLERASFVIGFNIDRFDFPVLSPYYVGRINQFPTLDLLEKVNESLGFRVALDSLAKATLGTKKSGHGLLAIDYFRKGQFDKLKSYCTEDVRITRDLYEYGKENKKLLFEDAKGKREFTVDFSFKSESSASVSLSLPI